MAVRDLVPLLITGGGVVLLCRYAGLTLWHAVLVLTGGFYLASSALGALDQPGAEPHPGPVRLACLGQPGKEIP
jgi:hypothetical protein